MLDTLAPQAAGAMPFLDKLKYAAQMDIKYLLRWPIKTLLPLRRAILERWRLATTGERTTRVEELADLCRASYLRAQGKYFPQPYAGDVLIFRASIAEALFLRAGPKWAGTRP